MKTKVKTTMFLKNLANDLAGGCASSMPFEYSTVNDEAGGIGMTSDPYYGTIAD